MQFLSLANTGTPSFLADSGQDLLEAWLATGMSEPVVMATTTWGVPFEECNGNGSADAQDIAAGTSQDRNGNGVPDECERKIRRATAPPPLR